MIRRVFSVAAWCPARRGTPRRRAGRWRLPSRRALDLHDLALLAPSHVVHLSHVAICQLLQPLLGALHVVLRHLLDPLGLAHLVNGLAPTVADRDARLLHPLMHL